MQRNSDTYDVYEQMMDRIMVMVNGHFHWLFLILALVPQRYWYYRNYPIRLYLNEMYCHWWLLQLQQQQQQPLLLLLPDIVYISFSSCNEWNCWKLKFKQKKNETTNTYLHGLHQWFCWSRPYRARHFFNAPRSD